MQALDKEHRVEYRHVSQGSSPSRMANRGHGVRPDAWLDASNPFGTEAGQGCDQAWLTTEHHWNSGRTS